MKLETFFEKFELFADAPGAVAKMRALVLELAVRGQLSERNPEDQNDPAWQVFLEKFDNRIHGTDPGPPFDIPNEWRWVCVDDVADACGQKRPDEPFTYIDVASIDNQCGIIKSDLEVLTPENAPSRARKLVRLGTVIYATVRPYLKNIAIIDREFSPPAIVSTAFAVLHPRPFVDSRFLFFWLRSKPFEVEVAERMKGVAYPAINDGEFRSCPVPLPPLAEQKRIVAKVDELMTLCDRLEAQQQERETRQVALIRASLARFTEVPTPANLQFLFHPSYDVTPADLRKTILTLAVQGKLVPQDPNDEPAEEVCDPDDELAEASTFEVPLGWIWTRLANLAEINGGFAFKSTAYTEDGMRVVRISDFDEFGFKDHKIVRHPFSPDLQKFVLEEQNILMAMTGGTVGKSYLVRMMPEPMVVNQRVATIKVTDSALPPYIDIVIRSEMTQEVIRKAKNSTNDNISMGDIKGFAVPLPPLAEQRRIVAKVEQLMALVDELEQQLAASRATAEKLLTALVAELVNGKKNHAPAEV